MHEHQRDQEKQITRRHALQTIALFPIQLYGLASLTAEKVKAPSEELLSLCAAGMTACYELRQYEPEGMQTMQRILAAYLPTLEKFAQQPLPSQTVAAQLATQGYLLVSILAEYYGKLDQMEAACHMARFYARVAHDPNLEVSALIRLGVKFDIEYQDIQALQAYQEASTLPTFGRVSPLLQGRVYAGLAGTHSYCDQKREALYFLGLAHDTYPTSPEDDPSFVFAFSDRNTLSCWTGLTYKHVEQYQDAKDAFLRVGGLIPTPGLIESKRGEHLNYTASVAVKQHDLDAAFLYLDAAEEIAWMVKHKQRYTEVRNTLRSMQLLWPDESKVKQLQEKMYERQR